jgi:hypothetical protein
MRTRHGAVLGLMLLSAQAGAAERRTIGKIDRLDPRPDGLIPKGA